MITSRHPERCGRRNLVFALVSIFASAQHVCNMSAKAGSRYLIWPQGLYLHPVHELCMTADSTTCIYMTTETACAQLTCQDCCNHSCTAAIALTCWVCQNWLLANLATAGGWHWLLSNPGCHRGPSCRYVQLIRLDIPSITVASLHTVGYGCRVPLPFHISDMAEWQHEWQHEWDNQSNPCGHGWSHTQKPHGHEERSENCFSKEERKTCMKSIELGETCQ